MSEMQPKNRGGRPRAVVPGYPVMTWLPKPEHQRILNIAQRTGEPVSRIVRRLIQKDVRPGTDS